MSITGTSNDNERRRTLKTIFLLGAGASQPAGIPTINKMTDDFIEHPLINKKTENLFLEDENAYRKKFQFLSNIANWHFKKSDIEYMMSVLVSLRENNEIGQLIKTKYYDDFQKFKKQIRNGRVAREIKYDEVKFLTDLQNKLEQRVRDACESISTVEYLHPFVGLTDEKPIKIFTLNYDATLEILCEQKDLQYTDGVNPYWDEKHFTDNYDVHIFKLHGSLYWLRTKFGKIFKVPIKGLKLSDVRFLTDEPVSEMMIYPALQKNKQSRTYSWLSQKFRNELGSAELCVIIGYSFRDDDVKGSILESLSINQKLWLMLVNPHASKIKSEIFSTVREFSSRIVVMDTGIEDAVTNRILHTNLERLSTARRTEDIAWNVQERNQTRLDTDYWNFIIRNYLAIDHVDRVRWIIEQLSRLAFASISGTFPDTIEGIVCTKSLQYLLDYRYKDRDKFEFWSKFFVESCTCYEYVIFSKHSSEVIRNKNPVKKSELPSWFRETGGIYVDIQRLKSEFVEVLKKNPDTKQNSIAKLVRCFDVLDERIPLEHGEGYTLPTPEQTIAKYETEELGIRKFAQKIVEELKF